LDDLRALLLGCTDQIVCAESAQAPTACDEFEMQIVTVVVWRLQARVGMRMAE
jgi:hypothetical protein